jgi:hypothetical protein
MTGAFDEPLAIIGLLAVIGLGFAFGITALITWIAARIKK